ncbi:MAG: TIGR01777 family oxidoreductase [Myxococcales bacterium]|nr:TIGR01777 family oxidoreductase [Myxococcales bacterium]MCB9735020.1 TIGR01777 family protein [Deltaproteobacteria bacterium]
MDTPATVSAPPAPKTVLVTGATGFIGGHLTKALAARGDTVWGLTRSGHEPGDGSPEHPVRRWFSWVSPDAPVPPAAVDGVDAVVHLAGEPVNGRWTDAKKKAIRESRVDGTRQLVNALAVAASRPAVLVSGSAIGYYGDRDDEILTESSAAGGDFLADVCQAWEAEALRAEPLDVRVVRLRTGLVMHPDGGALEKLLTPFKLGAGGRMGSGDQWWAWIHLDDLVRLIVFAIDHPDLAGAVNGTAPAPVRNADFAKALGHALHRPAILPAPAFALKLGLGEFATELTSSRRVVPRAAEAAGFAFRFPELAPALTDLVGR